MNMFTVWISLPFYLLSFYVKSTFGSSWSNGCNKPLGLQDRRVRDNQVSSPSFYEYLYIGKGKSVHTKPEYARLNNTSAWCASGGKNYYIQVDFKQNVIVTGIATQGFSGVNDYYVKQYKVVYSRDGVRWNSTKKVWRGNSDAQTVVNNTFNVPISARYIRLYPVSYNYNICMRMELYGCTNFKATTPAPNHIPRRANFKATTRAASRKTVKATTQASRSVYGTARSSVPLSVSSGYRVDVAEAGVSPSPMARKTFLAVHLTITASFLAIIVIVMLITLLIFLRHQQSKRSSSQYQVGNDAISLTTLIPDMELTYNQEIGDEYSAATEKNITNGITLL